MKIKEKLACEYAAIYNELSKDLPFGNECDPMKLAKTHKVSELEKMLDDITVSKQMREEEVRIQKYWETDEGKEMQKSLKRDMTAIVRKRNALVLTVKDWLVNTVNEKCEGEWTATVSIGYHSANFEIGMVNQDPARKGFTFQFGHTFTVYYEKDRLDINYGSFGCFNPLTDTLRVNYLLGMGKLVNDKEFLNGLRNKLEEIMEQVDNYNVDYDNLRKKLNNPFK